MKKINTLLSLALLFVALGNASAWALTANHNYTVQLRTVTATGQQTVVEEMAATTDVNGKLHFQFNDVPDTSSTPFLMVQIMDSAGGQMVRQSLVPAPTPGQQMQMGVSEISHGQTQAALQAMPGATNTGDAALRTMFPLTMIATGAMSDAGAFGSLASEAAAAFSDYLSMNGTTGTQMTSFQAGLMDTMRTFAANYKTAVDDTVSSTSAAGRFGMANAQLMTEMFQVGEAAGIDPTLLAAAFDHAGQAMDNSMALNNISAVDVAAMRATFMAGTQQSQMMGQLRSYATAMPVVGATATESQNFTMAMTTLQDAMDTARQTFCQQAFVDPTTLPAPATLDAALSTMQMDMQSAFDSFNMVTIADSTQIGDMLGFMADNMNGMGGMVGGGMLSGSMLSGLNLGMMQSTVGGALQNWSTMMVAATNLLPSIPGMNYTATTSVLTTQLSNLSPVSMPSAPDLSLLPPGPAKGMLQLQYDLMLVHLIDVQMAINLAPLDLTDMADISAADFANRTMVLQGMSGLTDVQKESLLNAMSPMYLL